MKELRRILIIDDEKDLCELVHLILKDESFQIDCAYSIQQGIAKWEDQLPHIVLLDHRLPDGLGLDILEKYPTLLNKTKVIMITADTMPKTKTLALSMGIHFFIQKPFSLKLIGKLINEIVYLREEV